MFQNAGKKITYLINVTFSNIKHKMNSGTYHYVMSKVLEIEMKYYVEDLNFLYGE